MPHMVIGAEALAGSTPICGPAEASTPKTPESSTRLFLAETWRVLLINHTQAMLAKVTEIVTPPGASS